MEFFGCVGVLVKGRDVEVCGEGFICCHGGYEEHLPKLFSLLDIVDASKHIYIFLLHFFSLAVIASYLALAGNLALALD